MTQRTLLTVDDECARTANSHTHEADVILANNNMDKPSKHEEKIAKEAVDRFREWDAMGKNTKYMEGSKTIQIRLGDALRVQFTINENGEKEITDVFKKWNHQSHR